MDEKIQARNKIFDAHYRANYETLVKKLRSFAGSHHGAEDVVQEAYTRGLQHYDEERIEDFNAWFNTILGNALKDSYSQRGA